jgi:hypothetical protein
MTGKREPLLGTALVLSAVNLAAVVAAPLVAVLAVRSGHLGVMGWLAPVLSFGTILSASLVAIGHRLSGQPVGWWPRLVLVLALALTACTVVAEAAVR